MSKWYLYLISPCLGACLSENDLNVVLEKVMDIHEKWYNFGLQLGVDECTLNAIKVKCFSTKDSLEEMLKEWLKMYASTKHWRDLVYALRRESMRENELANCLEHEYCHTLDTKSCG